MDGKAKHADTNSHTPEITRQKTNVEERRATHAEDDRSQGVEKRKRQCITHEVTAHGPVPSCLLPRIPIEDGRLDTIDDHAPETNLAHDLIQRTLARQELLGHITQAIERSTQERKQITLDLISATNVRAVGSRDMVGAHENAKTADADEDADDLSGVVPHVEEEEGDDDDEDDGPEVDELGGEDGGVAVGEDGEVVAFDIEEGEDDVWG